MGFTTGSPEWDKHIEQEAEKEALMSGSKLSPELINREITAGKYSADMMIKHHLAYGGDFADAWNESFWFEYLSREG